MLSCRDPDKLGFHKYACEHHPDQFKIIPNSCKSPFCNSCGKIATDKFVSKVEANFPFTSFHHICFTIPDSLRELFDKYRFLLNCLFKASSQTLLSFCKERHFLPLIIAASHTFGRADNFNPHIHLLTSSGGLLLKKNGNVGKKWIYSPFFPFKMLHKRYKFLLIDILKKTILNYLKSHQNSGQLSIFSNHDVLDNFLNPLLEINWYVHDSEELPPDKFTVLYIARYAKRPPIAESRILFYGTNPSIDPANPDQVWVTFFYISRTEGKVVRTVKVNDFIRLLIQHIPYPNFRQVRYYGALSNRLRTKLTKIVFNLLKRKKKLSIFLSWRERVISSTGKDPLLCQICGKPMKLVEVVYFSKVLNSLKSYYPP